MTAASPPAPQTIDELRATLLKAHGTTVGKDDPVLMVYSIHRVALDEFGQLVETARGALSAAVADASARHTADVQKTLDEIAQTVASNALRERLAAMQEAAVLADRTAAGMRKTLKRIGILTACNALAAVVCLGVLALLLS